MKILFLTSYVPHKAAAGEKNTMIMLNDLGQRFQVDLVYYKYKDEAEYVPENSNVKTLLKLKNSTLTKLLNVIGFPFIYPEFSIRFNWFVLSKLRKIHKKEKYDLLICNHSLMFLYAKFFDKHIPKILLSHDVIAQRIARSSSKLMQKICVLSEEYGTRIPNSYLFSFSQKDCDLIESIYKRKAYLCLDYIDEMILNKNPKSIEDYYVFFGDWHRSENTEGVIWFMEKVVPILQKKVHVKIIGRRFPIEIIEKINKDKIEVQYLGFVDDPYEIISQSKALLSPLFQGAGIKVKVIEALACGTPVIGTDIAFEGLPTGFDDFLLLATQPHEYIAALDCVEKDINIRSITKERFIQLYQKDSLPSFIENYILHK